MQTLQPLSVYTLRERVTVLGYTTLPTLCIIDYVESLLFVCKRHATRVNFHRYCHKKSVYDVGTIQLPDTDHDGLRSAFPCSTISNKLCYLVCVK
jgi:hypothetical protein